jgi:hypothetical protein
VQVSERARVGVQRQLTVGAAGDRFEHEADRVADAVMSGGSASIGSGTSASVQRECSACERENEKIRGKSNGDSPAVQGDVSTAIDGARGGGVPLHGQARSFFESQFGRDFSAVRVHDSPRAHSLAGSLQANAFTVGKDIFFNRGQYAPASDRGRRLIAHELTHVVQQSQAPAPTLQRQECPNGNCHDRYKDKPFDWGPKKTDDNWWKDYFKQQQQAKRLNFFHGTRWSVAKKIPGNVKAVGGGDFAAGFYTHHDANDKKAWYRALQWACRVARDAKEKYGGVIKFNVDANKYAALSARKFALTSLDQKDYAQQQADWIDFITTHGRQKDPKFQKRKSGGVWLHERRDPPPALNYDVVEGPFYKPLPGEAKRKPAASEFAPFAEKRDLPQQVVFANKGCDLLNDADTKVELKQHECDPLTGNVVEPPDESAAAKSGTPSGKEVPLIE